MAARPDSGARRSLCGAEFSRLLPLHTSRHPLYGGCVVSSFRSKLLLHGCCKRRRRAPCEGLACLVSLSPPAALRLLYGGCVASFTSASPPPPSRLPPPPVRGLAALAQALLRDLDPPPLVRGCADSAPPQTRVTRKDASRADTPLYDGTHLGLVGTLKQRDWNICQNAASHGRGDLGPFLAILRLAVRWRADPRDYGS